MQEGFFGYRPKSAIDFSPCNSEEPYKLALGHGYFAFSPADNLHTISPLEVVAPRVQTDCSLGLYSIFRIHAVSSMLLFLPMLAIAIVPIVIVSFTVTLSSSLFFS